MTKKEYYALTGVLIPLCAVSLALHLKVLEWGGLIEEGMDWEKVRAALFVTALILYTLVPILWVVKERIEEKRIQKKVREKYSVKLDDETLERLATEAPLDSLVWEDYNTRRKPGETDAQLRERLYKMIDEKEGGPA